MSYVKKRDSFIKFFQYRLLFNFVAVDRRGAASEYLREAADRRQGADRKKTAVRQEDQKGEILSYDVAFVHLSVYSFEPPPPNNRALR